MKNFFNTILSLLGIRTVADGLEVSDEVLRFVHIGRTTVRTVAVRLPPGTMEKGKIKNPQAFTAALHELRSKIAFIKKGKKVNIAIALSSVNVYSQVFMLPFMDKKDMEKAINLNVQMISPVDISKAYYGWQLLGRDESELHFVVAAAFADRLIVDEIVQRLYDAGFITVGVESRGLALVRTLRNNGAGVDPAQSYLLLAIDNAGIDFLVVRRGRLYFEYQNFWTDIADEKGQVTVQAFQAAMATSLRQVLNFSSQHWSEPLAGVILSTAAFQEEAEAAIHNGSALSIIPLELTGDQSVTPEWFAAFGCGLRGLHASPNDEEINLSGAGALDLFYEERLLDFMSLWRVLIPVVLGLVVVIFALTDNFLGMTQSNIESSPAFAQAQSAEEQSVTAYQASSTAFNQSVALVANAETQLNNNYLMIADIYTAAAANDVTVNNISFQGADTPILVAGTAPTETQVAAFRDAMQSDAHFGTVTLPLMNIQENSAGGYTFSMSFPLTTSF